MKITGIGTILVDHQILLPDFPQQDEKIEVESAHKQVGGPVPTALSLLSRLGHDCSLISVWEKDTCGEEINKHLQQEKIDFTNSTNNASEDGATGFAHVWINQKNGSRTVVTNRCTKMIGDQILKSSSLKEIEHLHLDGSYAELSAKVATAIKENGGTVSLDTGSRKEGSLELLFPLADIIVCPLRSLSSFTNTNNPTEGLQKISAHGVKLAVVTDGENGCWYLEQDQSVYHLPAYSITAVDSNGAGDIFSGALIQAMNSSQEIGDCIKFASAAAALKSTKIGNTKALPTRVEVQDFINSSPIDSVQVSLTHESLSSSHQA